MPEVKSMEQIWQEEKEKPCSYTESALAAMSAWERQQTSLLREENKRLREAITALLKGIDGLPPLTAIAGVLEKQYSAAKSLLSENIFDNDKKEEV